MTTDNIIRDLSDVNMNMVNTVGGKNASLGEMIANLTDRGINVPNGFVLTVEVYDRYMQQNGLTNKIRELIEQLDVENLVQLRKTGMEIRQLILDGEFEDDIRQEIKERYRKLSQKYDKDTTDVAVRSSATTEDLPDASFAGQQDSFLNVRGANNVINSIKACFASLFTDRAI